MDPLKTYVGTKETENSTMIEVTTAYHRKLDEKSLQEAIFNTLLFADELRKEWDNNNWFPCGFVNLKIDGRNPLVKFMKKYGRKDNKYYEYFRLEINKAYALGYNVYLRLPGNDAITSQCMNYKTQVYNELQKQLAFLHISSKVESMVD